MTFCQQRQLYFNDSQLQDKYTKVTEPVIKSTSIKSPCF